MHVLPAVWFDVHHHGPALPGQMQPAFKDLGGPPPIPSGLAGARRDPG